MGGSIGIVSGVTSLVGGLMGGSDSGGQAEGYANAAAASYQAQANLSNTQSNLAMAQWNRYINRFAPMENKLVKQVSQPLSKNAAYLNNIASVKESYANQGGNIRRTMAGRYPSGSGIETAMQAQNQRAQSKAISDTTATAEQNRLNQMYQVSALGRGLVSGATSGLSGASGSLGSSASGYMNLANMYNNSANQSYGSAGNALGSLAQMYMLSGNSGGSLFGNAGSLFGSGGNYVTNVNSTGWNPVSWIS